MIKILDAFGQIKLEGLHECITCGAIFTGSSKDKHVKYHRMTDENEKTFHCRLQELESVKLSMRHMEVLTSGLGELP